MGTIVEVIIFKPDYETLRIKGVERMIKERSLMSINGGNIDYMVDSVYDYIRSNYVYPTTIIITIQDMYNPNDLENLISMIGERNRQYLPFMIYISDNLPKPRDYDPIWI